MNAILVNHKCGVKFFIYFYFLLNKKACHVSREWESSHIFGFDPNWFLYESLYSNHVKETNGYAKRKTSAKFILLN